MDLSSLLRTLGSAAEKLTPLLGGPAGIPAAILGVAHSLTTTIASAKAIHTGPATPEADRASADLFAAVSKHMKSTFDRAEGG